MDEQLMARNSDLPDNNLRPFTSGITQHNNTVASIVLYTGEMGTTEKQVDVNYLKDFVEVKSATPTENMNKDAGKLTFSIPKLNEIRNSKLFSDQVYFGVFNNFSVIQVDENKDQIAKLHQNFGSSWNLFFFGATPDIYSFSGIFLDTKEYPYYQEFMTMYENFLAGRKCVENGFKMKIIYDGKIVGGYLMKIRTLTTADAPYTKTFSFSVVVTDENYLRENLILNNPGIDITGKFKYNALNNGHRVVKQYPALFGDTYNQTRQS